MESEMIHTKITQQVDGQIESYMVSTKLTLNRSMDGELIDQHRNTTADEWTDRELNGQHLQKNPKQMDGWRVK